MQRYLDLLRRCIPRRVLRRIWAISYYAEILKKLSGSAIRECPLCGYRGTFLGYGHPPRYDSECRNCGSLERHRLFWLATLKFDFIKPSARVLHFAAERVLAKKIMRLAGGYVTADIRPGRADLVLDLEEIDLPSESHDVVIANHVLEHVDDAKALKELNRILKPGGRLLATVPIVEGWEATYESPNIQSESERALHFGQYDHVRFYGRDFRRRIEQAGFLLTEHVASGSDCVKHSLIRGERIFICRKQPIEDMDL